MLKHLGVAALASLIALAALSDGEARAQGKAADKVRVLIIDGQNNHNWRITTPHMKQVLEASSRFTVDVATAPEKPRPPQKPKDGDPMGLEKYKEALAKFAEAEKAYKLAMPKFQPDLSRYDVILSNYNGDSWPENVQKSLEDLLKTGKIGLVIVHAANNSFGSWNEYNLMIGMGWRGPAGGDRLRLDENGKEVRVPKGEGLGSGHRYTGPFQVTVRDTEHPITKGMPREWMHAQDELYDHMRGPIQNIRLLATAYSDKNKKGTGEHEPMIWTVAYGKGRVFHTPMGHDLNGMRCLGFIATLQRGTEWAATGNVTLPLPTNFPTADKTSSLPAK